MRTTRSRLARFWAGVLGWEMADDADDGVALLPSDDTGFRIRFLPTQEPKAGPNQMHFDLTSTSLEDQQQTVARALELGGRHIDIGQRPGGGARGARRPRGQRVLRHRAGQQLPRRLRVHRSARLRRFAGGRVLLERGAGLAVGLGPGPGDRDPARRTAVRRSPGAVRRCAPKTGKNRLHFDLAPPADGDQQAEVDRLVSLGATRIDIGQGEVSWVVMADPDGNEFCADALPLAARPDRPVAQPQHRADERGDPQHRREHEEELHASIVATALPSDLPRRGTAAGSAAETDIRAKLRRLAASAFRGANPRFPPTLTRATVRVSMTSKPDSVRQF